jgi:hypothetical protein
MENPLARSRDGEPGGDRRAEEQEKLALQLRDELSKLSRMVMQIRSIRKQLDLHAELLQTRRASAFERG